MLVSYKKPLFSIVFVKCQMEHDQYENLNQIDRVHQNHLHEQDLCHNENIQPSFLSLSQISQSDSDRLQYKPLKEANFSLTHKILSSVEVPPQLRFTPYVSILPQKHNLTDNESFKRDTIIYLNHKVTSCVKEIIC